MRLMERCYKRRIRSRMFEENYLSSNRFEAAAGN
jgi:hypothetical protein